jgi:hypothetical protein
MPREPFIAQGGLFRLAGLIALIVAGREFSMWLRPIVATALGRDINAVLNPTTKIGGLHSPRFMTSPRSNADWKCLTQKLHTDT